MSCYFVEAALCTTLPFLKSKSTCETKLHELAMFVLSSKENFLLTIL